MKKNRTVRLGILLVLILSLNMSVYASEGEIELDSDEKIEYVKDDTVDYQTVL